MRPILRPGSHVLRRDSSEVQVGLDPQQAVILADDGDARATFALLSRSADVREYDERSTLDLLQAHQLLIDGSTFLPLVPSCAEPPGKLTPQRHDVAALARSAGDRAGALLEARKRLEVEVVTFADTPDECLSHTLADLLRETGAQVKRSTARVPRGAPAHAVSPPYPAASAIAGGQRVAALLGVGEPHRDLVDEWMRTGVPHVLLRLTEGFATLGPFVVPGRTACLRCLDAHHTDVDPCWPLLVAQYAGLSWHDRADGAPEPVDGLVAKVALAWAARDLASYAEDRTPSTWSTTIRFDSHLTSIETRTWLRHPECGCGWG